jgi:hypothetical protein
MVLLTSGCMSIRRSQKTHFAGGAVRLVRDWRRGSPTNESTLHQLSPYIGKIKSAMAESLIRQFTCKDETIFDPFSGCGTIALEAWRAERNVIANDLSPYAELLTRSKLFPPADLDTALQIVAEREREVKSELSRIDIRKVPKWVRNFFHPETLRESLAWVRVLKRRDDHLVLSCLMGILHHQRPGFLSFPCSHTVPYLRTKRFPCVRFPELYEYRSVSDRLTAKVVRTFRRFPKLDWSAHRSCFNYDASEFFPSEVDAIITSPPYMRQLDYGRDNRLRLWFLGNQEWEMLDERVSPRQQQFFDLMRRCFEGWRRTLTASGRCILILGDVHVGTARDPLPDVVANLAVNEVGGYKIEAKGSDTIPETRRVRRDCRGSSAETVLVLRKTS